MKKFLSLFLTLILLLTNVSPILAQNYECRLAEIAANASETQWNITYCVFADTPQQLDQIKSGELICRRAPPNATGNITPDGQTCTCRDDYNLNDLKDPRYIPFVAACGLANLLDQSHLHRVEGDVPDAIPLQDPQTGRWYVCYQFLNIDPNFGRVETRLHTQSRTINCGQEDVTPGDYSWKVYWDNVLKSLGLGGLPFYEKPGPSSLFCTTILGKGTDFKAINTALGCIATDPLGFTQDYLTLAIGFGGGLGLLLLLYAFFTIATAGGNPTKVQLGRQIISSVIQGLVIVALSVVLLNFLGINVLGLPGLS